MKGLVSPRHCPFWATIACVTSGKCIHSPLLSVKWGMTTISISLRCCGDTSKIIYLVTKHCPSTCVLPHTVARWLGSTKRNRKPNPRSSQCSEGANVCNCAPCTKTAQSWTSVTPLSWLCLTRMWYSRSIKCFMCISSFNTHNI